MPKAFETEGWQLNDENNLTMAYSSKVAIPTEVLEFVTCKCKTGCNSARCSCKRINLNCTDACLGSVCENRPSENADSDYEEDDNEEDD